MRFWTIQKKIHIQQAVDGGLYVPDFRLSGTVGRDPRQKPLFDYLLRCFNTVNSCSVPGLVFTFLQAQGPEFGQIPDLKSFMSLMRKHEDVVKALWKYMNRPENVLVEMEVNEPFLNPLYIDFNDFCYLMEPRTVMPPYTEGEGAHLEDLLAKGQIQVSPLPSGIIQGHLPFIRREQIVATYPVFSL